LLMAGMQPLKLTMLVRVQLPEPSLERCQRGLLALLGKQMVGKTGTKVRILHAPPKTPVLQVKEALPGRIPA